MPTKPELNHRRLSFKIGDGFNVDRAGGILKDVVLIAGDREAKGHGLYIDAETIRTAHECAAERKQLKGAIRHPSWDEYFSKGADRVLDFPGWFEGFSVKGAQLTAAKFEFFETFRNGKETAETYARLMEIAEKTPNLIGFSIEAWGYAVFVAKDGKEYGTKPDGVELKYDGVPALRVTDLFFAAFVDEPAATDGLFARFGAKHPALAALFGGKQKGEITQLIAELRSFATELEREESEPAPGTVPLSGLGVPDSKNQNADSVSTMKIIGLLKAKITDPKRFAAAMSIVGNTPEAQLASLSVEQVEAQLATVDLGIAQAEVTRLTTELGEEKKKVTQLETERNDWKTKYEKLKKSGKDTDVDLGAGDNAGADEPNPFIRGEHFNRTRQAELKKSDPERYAALKAAAEAAPAPAKK